MIWGYPYFWKHPYGDKIHHRCVASIGGVVVCVLRSVIEQKFQVFGIPLATQVRRMAAEAINRIEVENVDVKRLGK